MTNTSCITIFNGAEYKAAETQM